MRRNAALDGLRGAAALAVTFYHGMLHFDPTLVDRVLYRRVLAVEPQLLPVKLLLAVFNGESAVIVFFVLSGLVLRGALDRMSDLPFPQAAMIFTGRRLLRIYPAVVFSMAVFFALSRLSVALRLPNFPAFGWGQFLANATLESTPMHGPSWSIQVELMAIPFLLAAELLRRVFGLLGLLGAFVFALLAIDYPSLVFDLPALWPYLFMFFLGMLINGPLVAKTVQALHPASSFVALGLFIFARHVTERGAISGLIAQGLLAGLLVACVATRTDALTRWLRTPLCQYLGRISYGFYLLNVPALYVVWAIIETQVADPGHHPIRWGLASALAATALTLPLASWCASAVERPFIGLGLRLFPTRNGQAPDVLTPRTAGDA